jgi:hypothetical protein
MHRLVVGALCALGVLAAFDRAATAATETVTAMIVQNLTITTKTAVGSGEAVFCKLSLIGTSTASGSGTYTEVAQIKATGSGTTYSCALKLPLRWVFPSGGTVGFIDAQYSVAIENFSNANFTFAERQTGGTITSASVPTTGTKTLTTVAVIL